LPVPVFRSGSPACSRYAPEREAERFAEAAQAGDVLLVAGMGGGYHVRALARRFPQARILVAEYSRDDIAFLAGRLPAVRELLQDPRVLLLPCEEAEYALKEQYLPAVRPSFQFLELRSWTAEAPDAAGKVREAVRRALAGISADFSVQAHFGRLWQHNILKNLEAAPAGTDISFPTEKTAVIAAAGPSLDDAARQITERRDEFVVIATDTAYRALQRRNIRCDAVVSIDGQPISRAHFMSRPDSGALFVFDVCGNPAALRKIMQSGCAAVLASTGHPLARYAEQHADGSGGTARLLPLRAGAGTVAIAAADFALKAGFSKIVVAGADFSYIGGRAYARGTYLDDVYGAAQTRLRPAETSFCSLLFRTELLDCGEADGGSQEQGAARKTTPVLDSYRRSFEQWASESGLELRMEGGLRLLLPAAEAERRPPLPPKKEQWSGADFRAFAGALADDASEFQAGGPEQELSPAETAVLPYAAWLRNRERPDECGGRLPFKTLAGEALEDAARHTRQDGAQRGK
nr:DUF115 domain-containing protein [Treponemataceae bacterium]